MALPNAYAPIGHVLTTSAEHEAPLGHATAAAMLGVPHTEPAGHLPATLEPGAHTVPACKKREEKHSEKAVAEKRQ